MEPQYFQVKRYDSHEAKGVVVKVHDGKLELVGITSAMYLGGNSLFIGVKINGISDVFKENSIRCAKGWKCNLSSPYELKL